MGDGAFVMNSEFSFSDCSSGEVVKQKQQRKPNETDSDRRGYKRGRGRVINFCGRTKSRDREGGRGNKNGLGWGV